MLLLLNIILMKNITLKLMTLVEYGDKIKLMRDNIRGIIL
ncbi:hypothetical protein QU7_1258 [Clostridioides difficile P46]|nr:hypothetical protein QU7_1258 [Clostridioides difficile P46]